HALEDALLDREVLGGRLDHEVASHQERRIERERERALDGFQLQRPEDAAVSAAAQLLLDPLAAGVERLLGDVVDEEGDAVAAEDAGEVQRDVGADVARADDGDPAGRATSEREPHVAGRPGSGLLLLPSLTNYPE